MAMSTPTESAVSPAPARRLVDRVPPGWRTLPVAILTGVVVVLVAALAISLAVRQPSPVPAANLAEAAATPAPTERRSLQNVANHCKGQKGYGGEVGDAGKTLTFDMAGEDLGSGQGTIDGLMCVLNLLGTPDYVTKDMTKTRALDGRQTATWDVYTASWRYHPDDGLDVVIHVQ